MAELPTGTVTFLFTDVEGSTRLWEQQPEAMQQALVRHDAIIETEVARHGGVVVRPRGEGDSRFAVFARATDAVTAAAAIQAALHAEPWPVETPLQVRMALHTGEADLRDGDYYGSAVNRCARLRGVAHGGQVLLSQVTAGLAGDTLPEGVGLRDLGEHRLRDLERAEHVFQLLHPALPDDFPPLRSLAAARHNLPLQLTSFVGREQELAQIKQELERSRLLTLTGTGGCGKTRLALRVAAELLDRYPDGVWLVDLAALADPSLVPNAVVMALGLREAPGQSVVGTLLEALRDRRLLLLLDNCEHVLDAGARLASALLRGCPQVSILATSREALGIAGEVSRRVLSLPDAQRLPPVEQLVQCEAVQLFVERVTAVRPEFAVTGRNAAALAQLCARLDGIPLAIELAAARVRSLSVEQVAARLDQRFRLLTGGSRTALPRQQTLRAAIDWSYDLLSVQERRLFARLSVFAGGWTLEAAEAVCAGEGIARDEALDLLARLVEQSLALAEDQPDGAERYRLLESLRQYARERLATGGEAETLHRRHAHYCLALAEQAEPALLGPEQAAWLDRLGVEHDNLRAALTWYLDDREGTPGGDAEAGEAALRLGWALTRFWFLRVYRREGLAWLERALARGGAAPARVRANALLGAATLAFGLDDASPERWQPLAEASLAEYRRAGDRRGVAFALSTWGLFLRRWDHARGTALAEQGLAQAREVGEPWLIACSLVGFAYNADLQRADKRARARAAGEEALALFRRVGDVMNIAVTQRALGWVALREGAYNRAEAAFAEDLAGARALRDPAGSGLALQNLGDACLGQGDLDRARSYFEQAVALWRDLGAYRDSLARAVAGLGRAARELGEAALAQESFRESLHLWQELGDKQGIAEAFEGLGCLAAARGQPEHAVRLIGSAAALRDATDNPLMPDDQAKLDRNLEPARAALGDDRRAAAWAEGRAMSLKQAIADALTEGTG